MPVLDKIYRDYKSKDVAVVAIDSGEEVDVVSSFVRKGKYSMPILLSAPNEAVASYGINAYPTLVVIDKGGKLVDYLIGGRGEGALVSAIERGRAGAPPPAPMPPPAPLIRKTATAGDAYRVAVRFRRERNFADCVAALDRAVKLHPEWWLAHMVRAECNNDLKSYDLAIANFGRRRETAA